MMVYTAEVLSENSLKVEISYKVHNWVVWMWLELHGSQQAHDAVLLQILTKKISLNDMWNNYPKAILATIVHAMCVCVCFLSA